ncbi:kinase-like domain-containing protein [Gilbertella persicaria]|uniref:kinase-like domain-containing protein n=1 Tax=Gilbertella persicaria TaxID=101096 RepID=UPI00221E3894|nr:kinase-like domain-containing protein [Gilbertella persicaria]KAI8069781.1 kinase-like domain-containing protein [Gilbertella persicaria]
MQPQLSIGTLIDDLEITRVLNIGAYGQVYLTRNIYTFKRYVIKSLPHIGLDSRQLAFQRNEITLHSHLSDHPHIIRLEKVVQTPEYTHAILEYGSEGDLFSAITEKGLYYGQHDLIRNVFLQLIDAVRYSHQHHIFHRDLKPENVLVFDGGKTVKLADFGLATTDAVSMDFGCGSTFYFSPECQGGLDGAKRVGYATAPNDVWALGIILINLSAGRNPWRLASLEDETFCGFLHNPNLLLKILPVSMELNKILKRIFCLDPHRRITLDELYLRIQRCTHFTRTPEVARQEAMMLIKKKQKMMMKIQLPSALVPQHDLPSPPDTPNTDNRSLYSDSTIPFVDKKGGTHLDPYIQVV